MIDLLHIQISIRHQPFGTKRILQKEDGTRSHEKRFTKKVRIYQNAAEIMATSGDNGASIEIRCCPLKPLQGHNIFGSDNVRRIAYELITRVLAALSIKTTQSQRTAWRRGEFDIAALDITNRFRIPSYALMPKLLAHIFRTVRMSFRPATIENGTGITLLAPHRLAHWLLYDKFREFADKRKKADKYLRARVEDEGMAQAIEQRLCQAASNSVRMELKLSKAYLAKHVLNRGAAWHIGTAKEVYFRELDLLRLDKLAPLSSPSVLFDRLTVNMRPLRRTLLLTLSGENMLDYLSLSTFNGHRKRILNALGIDIKLDAFSSEIPSVRIADIFAERISCRTSRLGRSAIPWSHSGQNRCQRSARESLLHCLDEHSKTPCLQGQLSNRLPANSIQSSRDVERTAEDAWIARLYARSGAMCWCCTSRMVRCRSTVKSRTATCSRSAAYCIWLHRAKFKCTSSHRRRSERMP
jgi:hypothetical protein